MTLTRSEVMARSFRMTGTVCFVFFLINSGQWKTQAKDLATFLASFPKPVLISMCISLAFALGGQIWLMIIRKKSVS